MNATSRLRQLPSVDQLLQHSQLQELTERFGHAEVVGWARSAVSEVREQLLANEDFDCECVLQTTLERVIAMKKADSLQALQPVLNATGILLHTNLGRAPLCNDALDRIVATGGYTNLETDLASGKRSQRGERACELIARLLKAEDVLLVNNCAAATVLTLQTVALNQEVIVSRGQLVEIGGGFRLPEVFEAAGVLLREVGTTNRTYLRDYEAAISEDTGAVLRVHRSNFYQAGFVCEPSIDELLQIRRPADVPVIDDIGSGNVVDFADQQVPSAIRTEPRVQWSIERGADLVLFSGDKLFGGPQCGIIAGKEKWITRLARNPLMRALRTDKLTLAAMEATAEAHLSGNAFNKIPFLQMLLKNPDEIYRQCHEIVAALKSKTEVPIPISVVPCTSQVGGGSMPSADLPSFAICLQPKSCEEFAACLRSSTPSIQARVSEDRVLLDLRTILDHQLSSLVQVLQAQVAE